MRLSVVIPAYNEEENIRKAVIDVVDKFPEAEIVVVDDASTDTTLKILEDLSEDFDSLNVLTNDKNMGHGYTVRRGLKAAKGDFVLYIDADRQLDLAYLDQLPSDWFEKYDFISGWRVGRQDKLFRKITSFFLKMTILFRYGYYIKDANCPFKVYRRNIVQLLINSELPETNIIPIACLEVLARRYKFDTLIIRTPHKSYDGVREGFLQIPNKKFFQFISKAFNEIIRL